MYGGDAADYLPDVELCPATIEIYRVFTDLGTQWRIAGMSGTVTGIEYSAIPFVLTCHGLEQNAQNLRDLRVMESAALPLLNKKE